MKKALIYTRVSTEEQATSDRHSLKTQLSLCEKAIENSEEYALAPDGVYADPGKTATNMKRPGLQDMLLRVQEDKTIKAVFVQDTDRLARNTTDHLTIKALLQKHGVRLISVSQPGLEDTPEGNLMDTIIAGFNQFQSQLTARKSTKSMEQKFNEGGWPTHAALGYLNVGEKDNEKKRTVVVDPIRGPLVQEAFKLYATGDYSMVAVLDIIHEKGFRARNGKRLMLGKFADMFKNHFYYGEMRWRGLVGPGKHEPLIDKELFDRCQRITEEHTHRACRRHKHNFILRGFVRCGLCGSRYTAEHNVPKKKSYYHCNHWNSKLSKTVRCPGLYVEVADLENQVQEKFNKLQFSADFIAKIEDRLRIVYESKKSSVSDEKSRITQAKLSVESKLERAEHKLIDGVIDDQSFERLKKTYREQLEDFDNQISKLERSKNIKVDVIQNVLALARDVGQSYQNAKPELKQLYLGLFWHHFVVNERIITDSFKTPIVLALEQVGAISEKDAQKPIPSPLSSLESPVINNTVGGAVVEVIRTGFAKKNDATIHIPVFPNMLLTCNHSATA
ncbi:MAG: recombinase family protein [Patescibacteria group bacterium]|nr:recombinase family protein [Patescibacteria group bacterium]